MWKHLVQCGLDTHAFVVNRKLVAEVTDKKQQAKKADAKARARQNNFTTPVDAIALFEESAKTKQREEKAKNKKAADDSTKKSSEEQNNTRGKFNDQDFGGDFYEGDPAIARIHGQMMHWCSRKNSSRMTVYRREGVVMVKINLKGKWYRGKLQQNMILWEDGDIWIRPGVKTNA